jgi:hypothetical protein
MARKTVEVSDIPLDLSAKQTANTIGAAASITIQPNLLLKVGPQPLRTCLPYGATKNSSATNITAANANQPIMSQLKTLCSFN